MLCAGVADVFAVFQFEWAAASADLKLRAIFAFRFRVFAFAQFHGERVVPDFFPFNREYVSEAFEVALARVHVTVGSDAHIYHSCCACFYA